MASWKDPRELDCRYRDWSMSTAIGSAASRALAGHPRGLRQWNCAADGNCAQTPWCSRNGRGTPTHARPPDVGQNPEKAMSLLARVVVAVLLATTGAPQAQARDEASSTPVQILVVFNSDEGLARLARATAKVDFPALANQFEPQSNIALCGPTTTAIVLNAVRSGSRDLPRDRSRLNTDDLRHFPTGFDLTVPRFHAGQRHRQGREDALTGSRGARHDQR